MADEKSNNPALTPFLKSLKDAEKSFLSGRRSSADEMESAVRVFLEMLRGFEELDFKGPCVTVFGSARFEEEHPYYAMGREVGRRLAEAGYNVMTGGGPGIMEAANRGAREAGGLSIGCNIQLPMEQEPNPYLDRFVTWLDAYVPGLWNNLHLVPDLPDPSPDEIVAGFLEHACKAQHIANITLGRQGICALPPEWTIERIGRIAE